jgi:hypothetical protein
MKTILVLDDDLDAVESIRRILRVNRIDKVYTEGDREECLRKINEGKIRPYPIGHHDVRYVS